MKPAPPVIMRLRLKLPMVYYIRVSSRRKVMSFGHKSRAELADYNIFPKFAPLSGVCGSLRAGFGLIVQGIEREFPKL